MLSVFLPELKLTEVWAVGERLGGPSRAAVYMETTLTTTCSWQRVSRAEEPTRLAEN